MKQTATPKTNENVSVPQFSLHSRKEWRYVSLSGQDYLNFRPQITRRHLRKQIHSSRQTTGAVSEVSLAFPSQRSWQLSIVAELVLNLPGRPATSVDSRTFFDVKENTDG